MCIYYLLNNFPWKVINIDQAEIIHESGESQSWVIKLAWTTEGQTYGRLHGSFAAGEYIWSKTSLEFNYSTR